MDNKCSKCGGELITGRLMTGAHFVGFTPLADEKKFKPRLTTQEQPTARNSTALTR